MSELPPGWAVGRFDEIAIVDSMLTDVSDLHDTPHIAPNHIVSGTGELLEYRTIGEDGVFSPKHRFSAGQILYSKIRPYLNKCIVAEFDGLCSADMYPISARIEPRYLHRYMLSRDFLKQVDELAGNRVVLPKINQKQLSSVSIPTAPLNEQRRIVAKLEACEARIGAARAALDEVPKLLEQYRQSVLAAAFRGDLTRDWREANPDVEPATELLARLRTERRRRREQAELAKYEQKGKSLPRDWQANYQEPQPLSESRLEELPVLPEGWCWARIEEVCEIIGGLTKNTSREDFSLRMPYLRVANVYADRFVLDEIKEIGVSPDEVTRTLVERDDLLIVEGNGSQDQIGRVALWQGVVAPILHQNHLIKVRVTDGGQLLPRFVLYWLLSPPGRRMIESVASSSSGLYTLSVSKVGDLCIPVCPVSEQAKLIERISTLLNRHQSLTVSASETSSDLTTLTQSLLAKAFRGELVPQDPDDEPASVLLDRIRAERASNQHR